MIIYNKEIKLKKWRDGYLRFYDPTHPLAYSNGMVFYHRHVASLKEGRWLNGDEHVHHIDGNSTNNNPENIQVLSQSEHAKTHSGESPTHICMRCGKSFQRSISQILRRKKNYCSEECADLANRKVERPSKQQLQEDIENLSWLAIGRKYGVSDNAIRKWARAFGLLS